MAWGCRTLERELNISPIVCTYSYSTHIIWRARRASILYINSYAKGSMDTLPKLSETHADKTKKFAALSATHHVVDDASRRPPLDHHQRNRRRAHRQHQCKCTSGGDDPWCWNGTAAVDGSKRRRSRLGTETYEFLRGCGCIWRDRLFSL